MIGGIKGIPKIGKTYKKRMKEQIFSKNGLLSTPYLFPTVTERPKNQMNGAVKTKKTIGYLKNLIRILLGVDQLSYCFLVKRIVWDISSLSRLPKCR